MKDRSKTIQVFSMHCKCKIFQSMVLWVNQGLCQVCSFTNTTQSFSEIKFRENHSLIYGKKTNQIVFIYEKILIIEVSNQTVFCTYGIVRNCMARNFHILKLYDKKFWSTRVSNLRHSNYITDPFTLLGSLYYIGLLSKNRQPLFHIGQN